MKPLICLISLIIALSAANIAIACGNCRTPDSCYHNPCREHVVKVQYNQPVIYCEYHNDAKGNLYTVCDNCNKYKCVKEYFFDNYCGNTRD